MASRTATATLSGIYPATAERDEWVDTENATVTVHGQSVPLAPHIEHYGADWLPLAIDAALKTIGWTVPPLDYAIPLTAPTATLPVVALDVDWCLNSDYLRPALETLRDGGISAEVYAQYLAENHR